MNRRGLANQLESPIRHRFTESVPNLAVVPRIASLTLTGFRNYRGFRLDSPAPMVVVTGSNGAGKTNLLEALSLFSPGRGLRRAAIADFQHQPLRQPPSLAKPEEPPPAWAVSIELVTARGKYQLGTGLDTNGGEAPKRVLVVDGKPQKGQGILTELLAVIWLTPQLDRIFLESSSTRRGWFDRIVAGLMPDHQRHINSYDHALRERTRLLREGCNDDHWFHALESIMASKSVAIAAARNTVAEGLNRQIATRPPTVFGSPQLAVLGSVEEGLRQNSARQVEESLLQSYGNCRTQDRTTGHCSLGTHRSEITVTSGGDGRAAAMTSTGEQKSLLLALFVAEARLIYEMRGEPPLVLLDDLPAHFDEQRLTALQSILAELGGQVWLTGTNRADFASLAPHAQWVGL